MSADLPPPILSRPRYAPLAARPCRAALMIADAAGMAALVRVLDEAPGLAGRGTLILTHDAPVGDLSGPPPLRLIRAHAGGLEAAIDTALQDQRMGLQVFLAGAEALIARAQARVLAAGLTAGAIQAEHHGSIARRVQCVHCKTIDEAVTTDPFRCPGCGRALYVRDHFSRRLGAFQGVCIDAETPGIVPPSVEIRA